ncbi:MAG TPA: PPOX class F420-dependent oxidoreductase [Candidatus Acidoferrum sp.]|jgi:hypothetical protein
MVNTAAFAVFDGHKYLSLQTFRKNGLGVSTPVWFAGEPAQSPIVLYVYAEKNSGKIKRLRNNTKVKIAPCDIRGGLLGAWVDAQAEILTGSAMTPPMRLINRKYKPWKQILDFFASFRRRERCVIAIKPI